MSKGEERRYEFKFSRTQIALLFAGIGIMAAVMFALGTVVGKSLSEINTIIAKPATTPAPAAQAAPQAAPAQPLPQPPQPAASPAPQEAVTASPQPQAAEPPLAAQVEKQPAPAQVEEKAAPTRVEKTAQEEPRPTAEKQPRKVVKKPTAKPVATKTAGPNAPHKAYMLQVGSFAVKADADHLAKKLRSKGFKTTVLPIEVEGKGMWYRVRTGPYGNLQTAEKNLQKLQQINGLTPLVIAAN